MNHAYQRAASHPTSGSDPDAPLPGVIGSGAAMREVYRTTRRVAPSRACVLIMGETGTGKELVARAVGSISWVSQSVGCQVSGWQWAVLMCVIDFCLSDVIPHFPV